MNRIVRWPERPRLFLASARNTPQVRNAGFHRADRLKVGLGHVRDDSRKCGLAGAGRPPENDGGNLIRLYGAAKDVAFADDMPLPYELIESRGPHAGGEGRLTGEAFFPLLLEHIGPGRG